MKMNDLDTFSAEVRAIQGLYPDAHAALCNWAAWSRDCAPPCGYGIKPPPIFQEYRASDYDEPDLEEVEVIVRPAPAKAEAAEKEPYDQTAAEILNDRIHGPGGLSETLIFTLRAAYYTRGILERQMPYAAGWKRGEEHRFIENLSAVLAFTARFV